eukprot:CAMPEP_0174907252 /NCGR_PEP_ID=MMETSP0167-20121228/60044_1 /TAXON_ID=38298 /ORGANISM="Rhodella maculata, Strain CCMP736" /LENGTH=235 /DNA_ID=CAMNT_0016150679 /DNA_START=251 /DNA_END=954 /DNA_ORIENTATION=-
MSFSPGAAIHVHGLRSIKHGHSANVTFDLTSANALSAASRDVLDCSVKYVSSLALVEAHLQGRVPDPTVLLDALRTASNAADVHWSSTVGSGPQEHPNHVDSPYPTWPTTTAAGSTSVTHNFYMRVFIGYAATELGTPTPLELAMCFVCHDGQGDALMDTAALEAEIRRRFEAVVEPAANSATDASDDIANTTAFACHTMERLACLTLHLTLRFPSAAIVSWASVEVRKPITADL